MADLIAVKTFSYRHEAEHAQALLAHEGIKTMILGDANTPYGASINFSQGIQLLVHREQVEEAQEILKVFDETVKE